MLTSRSLVNGLVYCIRRFTEDAANLKGAKNVLTGERGINRVTLLGRAGQDPQIRGTPENTVVVFPLATSYTLKTRDGNYVQKTEWHRISIFRPVLKDVVNQHVKKGDRIHVSGSISYGQYRDKNDVQQRAASIIADDVINVSRPMHGAGMSDGGTAEEPEN